MYAIEGANPLMWMEAREFGVQLGNYTHKTKEITSYIQRQLDLVPRENVHDDISFRNIVRYTKGNYKNMIFQLLLTIYKRNGKSI